MGNRAWGLISLIALGCFPTRRAPLTPLLKGGTRAVKVPLNKGGTTVFKVPLIKGDLGGSRLDYKRDLL